MRICPILPPFPLKPLSSWRGCCSRCCLPTPRFEKLSPLYKRLAMLGLLALTALVACDAKGGWTLLEFFILAVIANQSAFLIAPKRTS